MSNWPRRRPLFSAPAHAASAAPRRRKKGIGAKFLRSIKYLCTAIGAMVLISMMLSCTVISSLVQEQSVPTPLPEKMVLYMRLDGSYPEYHDYAYNNAPPTMRQVSEALDAARDDKRVKGLVAVLRGAEFNMAHLYELRNAVKRFRDSGKFAYFYVASFDEMGQGLGSYYLASAFSQIWMQPVGALAIGGVKAEMPFAKDLMDKVGVTPDMFQRKEYKNIFESLTATEMSPATREVMTMMVGDIATQIRSDIAADRKIDVTALQALIDKGLLTDREALEGKLIDHIGHVDELNDTLRKEVTGKADSDEDIFIPIGRYARQRATVQAEKAIVSGEKKPKVALVYAVGTITPYANKNSAAPVSFMGDGVLSAVEMSGTFNDVIEDDKVKVVVVRIDSPGGSPSASETLRAKILRAQAKGKKVVVSMGSVAASGGYWMAAPADRIFATPLTLTGSIGVAGGKFVLEDLWGKVGVRWDGVHWGKNAGMDSPNEKFTESGRARYGAMMDNVYEEFVNRVAEGRKMKPADAEAIARGRVWTGVQAQKRGLVDDIGGLDEALDYAATLAGAKDRAGINIETLPKPETPFDRLMTLLEMQAHIGQWYGVMTGTAQMVKGADSLTVMDSVKLR
jgi:protease-4